MSKTKQTEKIERVYSTRAVAKMWGIPRTAIHRLVKEGRIRPLIGITKGYSWTGEEFAAMEFERL